MFRSTFTRGAIVLALLLTLLGGIQAQEITPTPVAVAMASVSTAVTTGQVNLRPAASTQGTAITTLSQGTSITVLGIETGEMVPLDGILSDQWLHVQALEREGYITAIRAMFIVTDERVSNASFWVAYGISDSVPSAIASGTLFAQEWLRATFDYNAPTVVISMFNQENSGNAEDGGSGAVALTGAVFAPRFYALNPGFINMTVLQMVGSGSHENMHGWQFNRGCLSRNSIPLGNWLNEGMAEFMSQQSLIHAGLLTDEEALTQTTLMFGAQTIAAPDLAAWESPNATQFHQNYGYNWATLAVRLLVEQHGIGVIQDLCEEAASRLNQSWGGFPTTFENVTGQRLEGEEGFYEAFNSYIEDLGFVERVAVEASEYGCVAPERGSVAGVAILCQGVDLQGATPWADFIVQGDYDAIVIDGWPIPSRYDPDRVVTVRVPEFTRNGITISMGLRPDLEFDILHVTLGGFAHLARQGISLPEVPNPLGPYTVTFMYRGDEESLQFVIPESQLPPA